MKETGSPLLKKRKAQTSTLQKWGLLAGLTIIFVTIILLYDTIGSHMQGLMVQVCYNIMLAVSLNLTVGILGELSLGHAGFMCIGAFAGAFFSKITETAIPDWWIRFPLALLIGGVLAALFGFLIGIPVLRLNGDYLAIVTLAFGEIIWNLCSVMFVSTDVNGLHFQLGGTGISGLDAASSTTIINGAQGITGIPRLPGQNRLLFIVGFVLVFITVLITMNLIFSRTGRAIRSIRDNSIAAESIGIRISKYKLIALAASAFFAGIAGVIYSQSASAAVPTQASYGYLMSIQILVFVVLGGMGSTMGSVIAAVLLTILPEWLRFLNDYRMLMYSVVLIGAMLINNAPFLKKYTEMAKTKIKGLFRRKKPVAREDA